MSATGVYGNKTSDFPEIREVTRFRKSYHSANYCASVICMNNEQL